MKKLFSTFICALMLVVSGAVSVFAVTFNVGNPIHLIPTDDTGNGHHDNDDGDTGRPKSPILTPVFYRPEMQVEAAAHVFPGGWAGLAYLNPMTGVLAMYRRGLMGGDPQLVIVPPGISPWWIAASCAMCLATLVIGLVALRRGDRSFGDAL